MVNIACFKYGDKYDYRHVNLLYNSIKKHYKNKFSFFCIGDNGENISPEVTFIELKEEFKYAFNKVKAFSNNFLNLKPNSRLIILDLDIEIMSDPSEIFEVNLEKKEVGVMHKWWQYPYRSCFIWGGVYVFDTGDTNILYSRLKNNKDHFYKKYSLLYNYKNRPEIDLPIKGEQDYVLETLTIENFKLKVFPAFVSETIQPEVYQNKIDPKKALKDPDSLKKDRLKTHFLIKSLATTRKNLIFNHYSGYVEEYIKLRYES
tara:strand:+ start:5224 stop:6003 length:780 start_codon:yes stop_codon:yes gene_type:complete